MFYHVKELQFNARADPRFSNLYFNISSGNDFRGPWNQGASTRLGETFQYIEDPIAHAMATNGLSDQKPEGTSRTVKEVNTMDKELSKLRSTEVDIASPKEEMSWETPAYDTPDVKTKGNGHSKKGK